MRSGRKNLKYNKIADLERRCFALHSEIEQLSIVNSSLLFRKSLLDSLCNSFVLLQASIEAKLLCEGNEEASSSEAGAQVAQLLHELLLQEGASGGPGQEHAVGTSGAAAPTPELDEDPDISRICPRSDPMALFNHFITQPVLAEAATLTPVQLAQILREVVLEASVVLFQHSSMPGHMGPEQLEQVITRHIHMLVSLMLQGRTEVIAGVIVYNLADLTVQPLVMEDHTARLAQLPPLLSLSQQQLQDIATGAALFGDLMGRIHKEQRQLQAQAARSNASTGISACGSISTLNTMLEEQQCITERMQVLLQKEYTLSAVATGFVVGCMSWAQLGKALTLSWPYPLRVSMLAQAIARYSEQQQCC